MPTEEKLHEKVQRTAITYLNVLNAHSGGVLNREFHCFINLTASTEGRMATSLVHLENEERDAGIQEIIAKLQDVSWTHSANGSRSRPYG